MKKQLFVVPAVLIGSALLFAQAPAQDPRVGTPGHPDWKGQTLQTSPAGPNANTGGLDPLDIIKKPLSDQWTSYSGDMSGKRYSQLKQVNTNTVKNLSLKWVSSLTTGCGPTGRATAPAGGGGGFGGGRGGGGGPAAPINVGGLGTGDANNCGPTRLGGGILFVDGIIYASSPSNVYAIDARDGTVLWHYYWKTRGGTSLQTRGVGMWRNFVYFELNDNWVVCLDSKTGKEIWKHEIAPFDQQVLLVERADGDQGPRPGRHRQRPRRPGVPEVARSAHRRGAVDPVFDAAESRRSRPRDLGEPGRRPARQRRHVDSRFLRSGDQPVSVWHRQPDAGLHAGQRRRRPPLHVVAARRGRRHAAR